MGQPTIPGREKGSRAPVATRNAEPTQASRQVAELGMRRQTNNPVVRALAVLVAAVALLVGAGLATPDPAGAAVVKKFATIVSITRFNTQTSFALDYVDIVPCKGECDTDFEISNVNLKIRSFNTTPTTRIVLLKDPEKTFTVSLAKFREARTGKDIGQYAFSPGQPFEFRLDETKKTIVEIRQLYFP